MADESSTSCTPTFAVVPVRASGNGESVSGLGPDVPIRYIPNDDGPLNISAKWNEGLQWAENCARRSAMDRWNVLILNDDVELEPNCVDHLAAGLRSRDEVWISYVNDYRYTVEEDMVLPPTGD